MQEPEDPADVDSAGVYFMSIEDFEWRPPRKAGEGEAEAPSGESTAED